MGRWRTRPVALGLLVIALGMAVYMAHVSAMLALVHPDDGRPPVHSRLREGGDAYPLWFGLRAVATGQNPYAPAIARQAQRAIWGHDGPENLNIFTYPLPALLWYLPGIWLDLDPAVSTLRLLVLLATAGVVALGLRLIGIAPRSWAGLSAATLLLALAAPYDQYALGQNAALAVAPALAAWLLYRSGHPGLAGAALPLAFIKPHYVILLAGGMALHALAGRQWRFFLGSMGSVIVLTAGGLIARPDWPAQWLLAMRLNAEQYPGSYLSSLLGDQILVTWGIRAALLAALAGYWWRHRHCPATASWGAIGVTAALAVGAVGLGINPGLYNAIAVWPALALILVGVPARPRGPFGRLVLALNEVWVVALPVAGVGLVLLWHLLPQARETIPFAAGAAMLAFAAALQGVIVLVGIMAHCQPAWPSAWRPRVGLTSPHRTPGSTRP
ncbi:MAG: DUF2029 domain-containing protein [Chloroflexi bacterium]|nr:DUF2029 domain-containing protein [Chloroflexota bacterium]